MERAAFVRQAPRHFDHPIPVISSRREKSPRKAPVHQRVIRFAEIGFAGVSFACGLRMTGKG